MEHDTLKAKVQKAETALDKARGHLMLQVERVHKLQCEFVALQAQEREAAKRAATAFTQLSGQQQASGDAHDPAAALRDQLQKLGVNPS
eukprot:4915824-Pyramimonas_sp.AAC.1